MFLKRQTERRRQYYLDKKQQARFAVEVALHALLFPLVFLALTMVNATSKVMLARDWELSHLVLSQFLSFCLTNWWVLLLSLGFVAWSSIEFSHRIFGPLHRFERALQSKRTSPTQPVSCKLRRRDYFHQFSEVFDEVLNGPDVAEDQLETERNDVEAQKHQLTV
ncbi:hypothetical protein MYX75_11130 [Acidobacteria bacterium AH-259-A15]|nr:hypothetical protein [Acidobacteria bacterium AH-259-A15]